MNDQVSAVVFSSEKATVLNAIYDVIDSLGLIAEHINSERGVILVRASEHTAFRIMVDTVFPSRSTRVSAVALQECTHDWIRVFFDELYSILAHSRGIADGGEPGAFTGGY